MPLFLNIWTLHDNPAIWEDPQELHWAAFVMAKCKMALALTLLHFELTPDCYKPPILTCQIILKSKNGIHVFLKKVC
ncbi:unnamed protein product [Rangifer tarandus platyrhynchus]|uniref:Uncharacterized protein n=1 Tax=Rangifer tarandus platyrhynchus TaxID=3082113 RepID=A0AC59Y3Q2_RANTA